MGERDGEGGVERRAEGGIRQGDFVLDIDSMDTKASMTACAKVAWISEGAAC